MKPILQMTTEELSKWCAEKFRESMQRRGIDDEPTAEELAFVRAAAEQMIAETEAELCATVPGYRGALQ
jgi:hypothetical protein